MARKRRVIESIKDEGSANCRPVKKARYYTDEDAKFAKIFDNLSNEVGEQRIKASIELVKKLFDSNHPQKDRIDETLKRLIRGLCSGRKAARLGFSVALTELLRQILVKDSYGLNYNAPEIFVLINSITKIDKSASGQEKKDYLLGRVFNYKALILSKVPLEYPKESSLWQDVIDQICQLAVDYQWLREDCGLILYDVVKVTSKDKNSSVYIEELINVLCRKKLHQTPQGVAIWLSIRENSPDVRLPKGFWHHQDPLSSKERGNLATVMREDYSQTADGANANASFLKSGMAVPQISFAWDIIITYLSKGSNVEHDKLFKRFSRFWTEIVDENLFADSASLERKTWGFQVFSKAIQLLPYWALPAAFSPRLMKCIINHRINSNRYLYSAAKVPLEQIRNRARNDPLTAKIFIRELTGQYGAVNFDDLTKTKLIEEVLSTARPDALLEIICYLESLAVKPKIQDQIRVEFQRRIVADLFLSLLRRHYMNYDFRDVRATDESWLERLLKFLIKCAYFKSQSRFSDFSPEPEISETSRNVFRTRLFSCLTCLTEKKVDGDDDWIHFVVNQIHTIQEADKNFKQNFTDDNNILRCERNFYDTMKRIYIFQSEDENIRGFIIPFRFLYSLTLLQIYNGEPDAISTTEDLESSFEAISQSLEIDSRTVIILIDIILSSLSRSLTLYRIVAVRSFTALTYLLTEDAIMSLFDILDKPENAIGQDDLYEKEESVEGLDSEGSSAEATEGSDDTGTSSKVTSKDDDDEEEIKRITSEKKGSEGKLDNDDVLVDDGSGSETSSSSDQESNEVDEELSKFNSLLANVLQVQNKEKVSGREDESSNESDDDDDDDDDDMDDDQMMALESHLTNIFKERKKIASKKQEQKDAKTMIIAFKNRVLDLLLVYIRKQHANPLSTTLILPLLRLIRTTSSKQLAEKAFSHLKQYYDICKSKGMPADDANNDDGEVLWEILKNVHVEATKSTNKMTASACSRSSLFIAKILISKDSKNYDQIEDQYALTQKDWYMDPKSKINPTMFTEWISWSIGTRTRK